MISTQRVHPALTGAALAASLGAGAAEAGGFTLQERSAAAQGASFAGADSGGDDITYAGFNPAALGNVAGFEAGASAAVVLFDVEAETLNPFTMQGARHQPGETDLAPAGAVGYRLTEDFVVGLTAHAPFGLSTEYPNDALEWPWAGAALDSEVVDFAVTPLIAWNVTPRLSVAAGPQIHYVDATLSSAAGAPGTLGAVFPAFPVGEVEGDTVELGFQAGLLFEPLDGTTLGLSYTSGYDLDIDGDFTSPAGRFDARARAEIPAVLGVGLRQALGADVRLLANLRYYDWSAFDRIEVSLPPGLPEASEVTDYDDAIFAGVGLEADVWRGLTLRGGVAYDETPTPDRLRSPRVPDSDRIWLSAGASYRWSRSFRVDFGYSLLLAEEETIPANGSTILAPVELDGTAHVLSLGVSMRF